jgi:hypothetical protein
MLTTIHRYATLSSFHTAIESSLYWPFKHMSTSPQQSTIHEQPNPRSSDED